jgi:hypothetical protein
MLRTTVRYIYIYIYIHHSLFGIYLCFGSCPLEAWLVKLSQNSPSLSLTSQDGLVWLHVSTKPVQQLDVFGCLICTAYNYLFSIPVSSPPLRYFIEHLASSTARRRWSWSCKERTGSCREGTGSRSLYCSSALDPTALRPPVRNWSGSRPVAGKGQGAGAARCRSASLPEPVLLVAGRRRCSLPAARPRRCRSRSRAQMETAATLPEQPLLPPPSPP